MLNYFKSENGKIAEIKEFQPGCWINIISPTDDELRLVKTETNIDNGFLRAALDIEETSRIETEEDQTLILIDVPTTEQNDDKTIFSTIPLAIITSADCIITVCTKETSVIKGFSDGIVRNVHTNLKTRFILQILYRVSTRFLFYLKQIDRMSRNIEKELHKSLKNKELIQLLDLERVLCSFQPHLKPMSQQ